MDDREWLAARFEQDRPRLRAVAYRMLGTATEADDAVQEAWLRLDRTDAEAVDNLSAWLTTVVARISLNMLRSRQTRREEPLEAPSVAPADHDVVDPAEEAMLADSVGLALLVVLDTLTPAERLAFVLHDMFDLPFDEIAPVVGRSTTATRQLASRARRRVRGSATPERDLRRQRRVVDAYLAAARAGDFEALVSLLDPDVVLRADAESVPSGVATLLRGAGAVAQSALASGPRARRAELALIDGQVGIVMSLDQQVVVALSFSIVGDRITTVDVVGSPERLRRADIVPLDG